MELMKTLFLLSEKALINQHLPTSKHRDRDLLYYSTTIIDYFSVNNFTDSFISLNFRQSRRIILTLPPLIHS